MHCTECGYNCHEKCVQHVPKNCSKLRPASLAAAAAANVHSATAADSGTDATLVASHAQSAESSARGMSRAHMSRAHMSRAHMSRARMSHAHTGFDT